MKAIARRELARLAGVTQATITKAAQPGGPLADAALPRGRGLDMDHPKLIAWLKKKQAVTTSKAKPPAKTSSGPTKGRRKEPEKAPEQPDGFQHLTLEAVAKMPIHELVRRFEHVDDLRSWLDAAKKLADTRAQDLRNLESEGRVIERELVRVHVFGAMEASHVRLLGDAPKSITRRVYAMARSGEAPEQAERVVREMIGSHIKPAMAAAIKAVPE